MLFTVAFKFNLCRYKQANITHAVAKMSAAGKLATDTADVQGTLAALEARAVLVAPDMKPQEVSNAAYGRPFQSFPFRLNVYKLCFSRNDGQLSLEGWCTS